MFNKEVYSKRRSILRETLSSGIAIFPGNNESAYNYPANTYHFRQDSFFIYYFGLQIPDMVGIVDVDKNEDILFANDVDIEDIIWMGPQPSIKSLAANVGIQKSQPLAELAYYLKKAIDAGQKIHFLPPYRGEQKIQLSELLNIPIPQLKEKSSVELIKAVVAQREIKDADEVAEIEKAVDIAYEMHTTSMKMAHPGVVEQEIAGAIEGISLSLGNPPSFPIILSMNGETLHNHNHHQTLEEGRLMVTDAGAETTMHYSSDITRTVPVGGKFSPKQKAIYNTVLDANMKAIEAIKPGVMNREIHFLAARTLVDGLKKLGLMKGDTATAVENGAHALFQPHGLGHMMGLDVHDMEGLGEDFVGYDDKTKRSTLFGTAYLRLAKELKPGFVLTVEPGCYFIPALIDKWKSQKLHSEFINYDEVEKYRDFGGIRIEDDILVTETGHRVLGKPIPKTVEDIEAIMASSKEAVEAAVKANNMVKIKSL